MQVDVLTTPGGYGRRVAYPQQYYSERCPPPKKTSELNVESNHPKTLKDPQIRQKKRPKSPVAEGGIIPHSSRGVRLVAAQLR